MKEGTDKELITFVEAVEMVLVYWDEESIININKKLMRKYRKKVEYLLMIGAPSYKATVKELPKEEEKKEEEKTS